MEFDGADTKKEVLHTFDTVAVSADNVPIDALSHVCYPGSTASGKSARASLMPVFITSPPKVTHGSVVDAGTNCWIHCRLSDLCLL